MLLVDKSVNVCTLSDLDCPSMKKVDVPGTIFLLTKCRDRSGIGIERSNERLGESVFKERARYSESINVCK